MISNAVKNIHIPILGKNYLPRNYFPTKLFLDLYLTKFLYILTKFFFVQ